MKQKHRISADTHVHFVRNIETLTKQLADIGLTITDMKITMTTFNSDCGKYGRRYKGVFYSVR